MRNRIWYSFVHSKTNAFYSANVLKYYKWADWILNSFLVLTTSTSIGAWLIWQKFPILWGGIVAVSQVLMLLKPFLLFPKYVNTFQKKVSDYQQLSWSLEKLLRRLDNGDLDDKKALEEFDSINMRLEEADKYPPEVIIITYEKALTKAEKRTNMFIENW